MFGLGKMHGTVNKTNTCDRIIKKINIEIKCTKIYEDEVVLVVQASFVGGHKIKEQTHYIHEDETLTLTQEIELS